MGRPCKCQICKTKLNTDTAYKVVVKDKNKYYCSKEEYDSIAEKKRKREKLMIYIASEILEYQQGQIVPPILKKKINELNKFYDYEVIEECFRKKKDDLLYWKNAKEFKNEYGMVSYLMTIIKSNINDVYKQWKFKQKQLQHKENNKIDIDIINTEIKQNKKAQDSIADFLEEDDL